MKRRPVTLLLAALLALLFLLSIRQLYVLRFQTGDVYPPYTSLRADPLGTKALFDALDRLPGVTAERAYRDPEPSGPARTILLLGVDPKAEVNRVDLKQIKTLAADGARIVVAYLPELKRAEKPKKKPAKAEEEPTPPPDLLDEEFGFRIVEIDTEVNAPAAATAVIPGIEEELPWNSVLGFESGKKWRTLLRLGPTPVAIERSYGKGSLVLLTDAYLFSNEALREDRSPRALGYLLGRPGQVIFDETLHGLHEQPGVAGLMRRYHLEPFLLLAGVLAALFIWQNLLPLVPIETPDRSTVSDEIRGRDALSGRTSLLRRSVLPGELIAQCCRLWQESAGRRAKTPLPPAEGDPVTAYQKLTQHLQKRKF